MTGTALIGGGGERGGGGVCPSAPFRFYRLRGYLSTLQIYSGSACSGTHIPICSCPIPDCRFIHSHLEELRSFCGLCGLDPRASSHGKDRRGREPWQACLSYAESPSNTAEAALVQGGSPLRLCSSLPWSGLTCGKTRPSLVNSPFYVECQQVTPSLSNPASSHLVKDDGGLDSALVLDALQGLAKLFELERLVDNVLGLDLARVEVVDGGSCINICQSCFGAACEGPHTEHVCLGEGANDCDFVAKDLSRGPRDLGRAGVYTAPRLSLCTLLPKRPDSSYP